MVINEQKSSDWGKGGRKKGQVQRKLRDVCGFSYPVLLAPFTSKVKNLLIKIYFYLFIIENVDRS